MEEVKPKSLRQLTESDFNKLKKSGLLKTIYPDAPSTYIEITGTRPKPLENPDFRPIIKLCEAYLDGIEKGESMDDMDQYISEEAVRCVYGDNKESKIFDFINLQR